MRGKDELGLELGIGRLHGADTRLQQRDLLRISPTLVARQRRLIRRPRRVHLGRRGCLGLIGGGCIGEHRRGFGPRRFRRIGLGAGVMEIVSKAVRFIGGGYEAKACLGEVLLKTPHLALPLPALLVLTQLQMSVRAAGAPTAAAHARRRIASIRGPTGTIATTTTAAACQPCSPTSGAHGGGGSAAATGATGAPRQPAAASPSAPRGRGRCRVHRICVAAHTGLHVVG